MPGLFRIVGLSQQPRIQRLEIGLRHVDFAANLKQGGHLSLKPLRNFRNRPHIGGHILANLPVTARRCLHQFTIFIAQRAGQPVNLVLRRQRHRRIGRQVEETPDARHEIFDILVRKGVVEAHHPFGMRHFAQRRCLDRRSHLRIGAIRPHQLRKGRLQLIVTSHQRVKFRIGNFGRIIGVIAPVMVRNRLCQPHQFIGGVSFSGHKGLQSSLDKTLGCISKDVKYPKTQRSTALSPRKIVTCALPSAALTRAKYKPANPGNRIARWSLTLMNAVLLFAFGHTSK